LKILSIRQPWAALIVGGFKDVENRTWPTRYRGLVLIHASLRADDTSSEDIERRFAVSLPAELPLGGIVGMTEIVDCVRPHPSKWYAPGHYAFVLAKSRSLPFVKWKGALLLRDAPAGLLDMLNMDGGEAIADRVSLDAIVPAVAVI
jgi:ASCH domain